MNRPGLRFRVPLEPAEQVFLSLYLETGHLQWKQKKNAFYSGSDE